MSVCLSVCLSFDSLILPLLHEPILDTNTYSKRQRNKNHLTLLSLPPPISHTHHPIFHQPTAPVTITKEIPTKTSTRAADEQGSTSPSHHFIIMDVAVLGAILKRVKEKDKTTSDVKKKKNTVNGVWWMVPFHSVTNQGSPETRKTARVCFCFSPHPSPLSPPPTLLPFAGTRFPTKSASTRKSLSDSFGHFTTRFTVYSGCPGFPSFYRQERKGVNLGRWVFQMLLESNGLWRHGAF